MANKTQANLSSDTATLVSGDYTSATFLLIANQAVRSVLSDIDLKSTLRRSVLSPNLFDDVYQYAAPSDLKGYSIVDIQPQINRGRRDYWKLTTPEEFDRYKNQDQGTNYVALDSRDGSNLMLLSMDISDSNDFIIDRLDSVGDWEGFGDGENLTADTGDYVKGSASINWDINADGGTTAGIVNSSLTSFDISDYLMDGSVLVWAYISDTDDLTNFILRLGSSSSNYYSITVTTNNEGNSFVDGWNLLRFDMEDKSETGSVTDTAIDYCALYITKDSGKTDETDYRFDQIQMKKGLHYYTRYYSKYGWQTSAGTWLADATTTTDVLNASDEEYEIILAKTCSLMEQHLGNQSLVTVFEKNYQSKKQNYIIDNVSQVLTLITTYWDL